MKRSLKSALALTAIAGLLVSTSTSAGDRGKKLSSFDKCRAAGFKRVGISKVPKRCSGLPEAGLRTKCVEIETACAMSDTMREYSTDSSRARVEQAKGKVEIGEAEIQKTDNSNADEPSVHFTESCDGGDCQK